MEYSKYSQLRLLQLQKLVYQRSSHSQEVCQYKSAADIADVCVFALGRELKQTPYEPNPVYPVYLLDFALADRTNSLLLAENR